MRCDYINFVYSKFSLITEHNEFKKIYSKSNDFEEYKSKIMDMRRLQIRFDILARFQIPLIAIAAKEMNIYYYIASSYCLPEIFKIEFSKLMLKYDFLTVEYFEETANVDFNQKALDAINTLNSTIVITSRIDDDDIIHPYAIRKLQDYIDLKFINYGISFPKGYYGYYKNNKYEVFSELYCPNIAVYLSYIGFVMNKKIVTPYLCCTAIPHHVFDRYVPVVSNATFPAYIYTQHLYNSYSGVKCGYSEEKLLSKYFTNSVDKNQVIEYFRLIGCKDYEYY